MAKILVADDETDLEVLIKQKFRQKIREQQYEFIFASFSDVVCVVHHPLSRPLGVDQRGSGRSSSYRMSPHPRQGHQPMQRSHFRMLVARPERRRLR